MMDRKRPILFSGPMVRAILEGRKTQTRRVIKPQPEERADGWHVQTKPRSGYSSESTMRDLLPVYCPYGQPGDRLWVRETWMLFERTPTIEYKYGVPPRIVGYLPGGVGYRADYDGCGQVPVTEDGETVWRTPKDNWRPSIFMPRKYSRLTLEVTGVRAERLQEISHTDALAEGVLDQELGAGNLIDGSYAVTNFARLWDSINGATHPWSSSPWVWVVSFAPRGEGGEG